MENKNPFPKTLAATKSPLILAIVAGLPVDANGHYLSDAQLQNIEAALAAAEKMGEENAQLQQSLDAAQTAQEQTQSQLTEANTRIATLEAQDATPASAPAAATETVHVAAEESANDMAFQKELYAKL